MYASRRRRRRVSLSWHVIKSYLSDARSGLRTDVAEEIDDLVFQIVASCVDKGTSRQDIQGLEPQLLMGGSTLDLQAKANLYTGSTRISLPGMFQSS